MNNPLKSSVVAITGGTGSFGSTMVKHLLNEGVAEIRVFSRDETKQDHMRNEFGDERIRFMIGDVREGDPGIVVDGQPVEAPGGWDHFRN